MSARQDQTPLTAIVECDGDKAAQNWTTNCNHLIVNSALHLPARPGHG